jgi:FMN-dependent dehydrogenase
LRLYVSNHGERQLDHGLGSIDVLPEIVAAVGRKARIIVNCGISRGTDVVKAMILGADAVAVGRLCLWPRRGRRSGNSATTQDPQRRDPHLSLAARARVLPHSQIVHLPGAASPIPALAQRLPAPRRAARDVLDRISREPSMGYH